MAQHLTVALRASIVVSKIKNEIGRKLPVDIAIETVKSNYDLSLYEDYIETDHYFIWKLKDEILSAEIVDFVEKVLTFYYDKEEATFQSLIGEIKRKRDYEGLIKLSKGEEYEHFEHDAKQYAQFSLKKYGRHLQVDYHYIKLFTGDKMRYDNFDKMLAFMQRCIQHTFSELQLSKVLELYFFDTKNQ
jgi:hypothetical protein